MEFLHKIKDRVKSLETSDIYKYFGIFFGIMLACLALLTYVHYSKVSKYTTSLKTLEKARAQTKKILRDYKAVSAQKAHVEEILAENKNFRVGEAYQSILERLGLTMRQTDQTAPTPGESISGKTEIVVSSHINGITMKQLTNLLSEIGNVPQMYTKDLVIKKNPQAPVVDIYISVATLEPSSTQ